jgi:hypothetical protein
MLKNQKIPNRVLRISVLDFRGFGSHSLSLWISIFDWRSGSVTTSGDIRFYYAALDFKGTRSKQFAKFFHLREPMAKHP